MTNDLKKNTLSKKGLEKSKPFFDKIIWKYGYYAIMVYFFQEMALMKIIFGMKFVNLL